MAAIRTLAAGTLVSAAFSAFVHGLWNLLAMPESSAAADGCPVACGMSDAGCSSQPGALSGTGRQVSSEGCLLTRLPLARLHQAV